MAKKVERWYSPGASLKWSKSDSQAKRRRNALSARHGDALAAARGLQSLANVTKDSETKRKARADAKYFYRLHAKKKRK